MKETEKRMIEITKIPVFVEEVSFFTLPNQKYYKEKINEIIKVEENKSIHKFSTTPNEEDNVKANRSAWDSHFRYPVINELTTDIKNIIHQSIKQDGYDAPDLVTINAWVNWYKKNQSALSHIHGTHIACVYFVDVEKTNANFFFSNKDVFRLVKKDGNKTVTNQVKEISAKDGTVIFFSGNTYHSVLPNLTDHLRITFACNFAVEYDQERKKY
jgi:hypothetical protein